MRLSCLLMLLLSSHCPVTVPASAIPERAEALNANTYILTVQNGSGPSGACSELYGYNDALMEKRMFGSKYGAEFHGMSLRRDLSPDWQLVFTHMDEGEIARVWLRVRGSRDFTIHRVLLSRVDRIDSTGEARSEWHDLPCAGALARKSTP